MEQSNHSQTPLKLLLGLQTLIVGIYTVYVGLHEGMNFPQVTISNLLSLQWIGQFTLDFICYLLLSGLWIMWRNRYSTQSIIIGGLAMILGIIVFAPYFIYVLGKEQGDLGKVLLGDRTPT